MVPEIVQHGHCHNCGRVVKFGETTCSEACKTEWERMRRSRRRSLVMMYILLGVTVLIIVVLPLLGGGGA